MPMLNLFGFIAPTRKQRLWGWATSKLLSVIARVIPLFWYRESGWRKWIWFKVHAEWWWRVERAAGRV